MKILTPLALALAAALLAAGCGGGKSRNTAYAGSKADYVAALNSICAKANQEAKGLDLASMSAVAQNGERAQEIVGDTVDKIDDLEPPDEVKTAAESFVEGARKEGDKIGELTDAAKDNDETRFNSIRSEISSIDAATSEDARFIGATGCAS